MKLKNLKLFLQIFFNDIIDDFNNWYCHYCEKAEKTGKTPVKKGIFLVYVLGIVAGSLLLSFGILLMLQQFGFKLLPFG